MGPGTNTVKTPHHAHYLLVLVCVACVYYYLNRLYGPWHQHCEDSTVRIICCICSVLLLLDIIAINCIAHDTNIVKTPPYTLACCPCSCFALLVVSFDFCSLLLQICSAAAMIFYPVRKRQAVYIGGSDHFAGDGYYWNQIYCPWYQHCKDSTIHTRLLSLFLF